MKGYVFIDEHSNKGITKIKSWDVTFLENEFPNREEMDQKNPIIWLEWGWKKET